MLGFTGPRASVFEVFIQLGAILSVIVIYKEKFIRMLHQYRCWDLFRRENWFRTDTGLTLAHVAAGIVPVMGIGYLAHHAIKTYLFSSGRSSSASSSVVSSCSSLKSPILRRSVTTSKR